jgi:16S rRNA (cytosine967-C5)-methyltransferase
MNEPATVTERDDGYVQDPASQEVAALAAQPGLVADLCAAPGGKATAMARTAATVVASDVRRHRVDLVAGNVARVGAANVRVVAADGAAPPYRPGSFDAVLVDAPCSGLGTLRRRPDARWRIDEDAPTRLAALQRDLLAAASTLVKPGGLLTYSVCTLTTAEGPDVAAALDWPPEPGALLLPQDGTDGMFVARWRRPT